MTRKRFKRLLMAARIPAREAEAMCWAALWEFGCYELAWREAYRATALQRLYLAQLGDIGRRLAEGMMTAMEPAINAIRQLAHAIVEAAFRGCDANDGSNQD